MDFSSFYKFFDVDHIKEIETSNDGSIVWYEVILKPNRPSMTENYRLVFAHKPSKVRRTIVRINVTHSLRNILMFIGIYDVYTMEKFCNDVFMKYGKDFHNRRKQVV